MVDGEGEVAPIPFGRALDKKSESENVERSPDEHVFGGEVLDRVNKMRAAGDMDMETVRSYEFEGLREVLCSYAQQDRYKRLFQYFFWESFDGVEEFRQKMKKVTKMGDEDWNIVSDPHLTQEEFCHYLGKDLDGLAQLLSNKEVVDDDLFEKLLENHRVRLSDKVNRFRENESEYIRQFSKKFEETAGRLDISVEPGVIGKRLHDARIFITDSLHGMMRPDVDGINIVNSKTSFLNVCKKEGDFERITFHELLHEVSGYAYENGDFGDGSYNSIERNGLYKYLIKKDSFYEAFNWLDEAVTESLTYEMLNHDDPVYTDEILLFGELMANREFREAKSEISPNIFYDAYFEDGFDTDKWKRLVACIDESYSPGFLSRLDEYVARHGVKDTLETFREDWRIIDSVEEDVDEVA